MIELCRNDYEKIVDYAKEGMPFEVCGLLGGVSEGDKKIVKKTYFLTNTDKSEEHFSMDPKEQFAAVKDMRNNGWELLGNFHSHPSSPSRPSEEDKRLAYDSASSYLILSLMESEPVLNSFKIDGDKNVTKEELVIV